MRHFDAHAYRTEDTDGVWDFARGCMRTYLILRDKVRRFHEDADIAEALPPARRADIAEPTSPGGSGPDALAALRAEAAAVLEETLAAAATATSVSTSWSPSCCSGCAERWRLIVSGSGRSRRCRPSSAAGRAGRPGTGTNRRADARRSGWARWVRWALRPPGLMEWPPGRTRPG